MLQFSKWKVTLVVLANARVWWQLLAGRRPVSLSEDPYVPARAPAG